MKLNKKSGLSMILALLMASSVCIGCGDSAVEPEKKEVETKPVSGTETTVEAETDDGRIYPSLPEDLDFEGHSFGILNCEDSKPIWTQIDIGAEALNGDTINDAVYQRNTKISELYNCTINSVCIEDITTYVSKAVKAGDTSYDIATPKLRTFASLAMAGNFINLFSVENLDLSKPWFDQNSVSQLSINNCLYGVAADLTLMDKQSTTALIFNKDLYRNYSFEDDFGSIYDLVKDGKWTYENLTKIVTSISGDLDGDGKRTEKDLYGLLFQRDTVTSFLNGFGLKFASKDADDLMVLDLMNDHGVEVLDLIFDLLYQEQYCMNVMIAFSEGSYPEEMADMFADNHGLFMWIRLADCKNLRTMDVDFGIVPIPKLDESQENYISAINSYNGTMSSILVSTYDPEMAGYFLQAISAESRYTVLPAYYDVTLKGKVSRDEESADMLDIIFENRVYDLGEVFDPGNFANYLIYMTMNNKRDFISRWAKVQKTAQKKMDEILESFTD